MTANTATLSFAALATALLLAAWPAHGCDHALDYTISDEPAFNVIDAAYRPSTALDEELSQNESCAMSGESDIVKDSEEEQDDITL